MGYHAFAAGSGFPGVGGLFLGGPFLYTKTMIYSLSGTITLKQHGFAVVSVAGVGYKVFAPLSVLSNLPVVGGEVTLLTHHHVRDDANDLYGFLTGDELMLFQSLISISGVGPKSAMGVMGVAAIGEIITAINEGRTDLLTKASGVGKKTAERVVLELKGKLSFADSTATLGKMEKDLELEETLVSLGYSKQQAKAAIAKIDPEIKDFNERLKEVLKGYKK